MGSKKAGLTDKWSLEGEPVKVEKWDGSKVKHALDDAAKKAETSLFHRSIHPLVVLSGVQIMGQFGYEESHSLTDQRLAICTVACSLSLGALIYDYFFPFPASKYVLGFCSVGYFTLMLVFTIFVAFKEKNYVYWGIQKDKAGLGPAHYWSVQSSLKRYEHIYTIVIAFQHGKTNRCTEATMSKSIGSWFDTDGCLLERELVKDIKALHSEVLADRKDGKEE